MNRIQCWLGPTRIALVHPRIAFCSWHVGASVTAISLVTPDQQPYGSGWTPVPGSPHEDGPGVYSIKERVKSAFDGCYLILHRDAPREAVEEYVTPGRGETGHVRFASGLRTGTFGTASLFLGLAGPNVPRLELVDIQAPDNSSGTIVTTQDGFYVGVVSASTSTSTLVSVPAESEINWLIRQAPNSMATMNPQPTLPPPVPLPAPNVIVRPSTLPTSTIEVESAEHAYLRGVQDGRAQATAELKAAVTAKFLASIGI